MHFNETSYIILLFIILRHWLWLYIDSPYFIGEVCIQLHQSIILQESLVLVIEVHIDFISLFAEILNQYKSGSL